MASVTLSEIWINDTADMSDYVTSYGFAADDETYAVAGSVRTMANGRRRTVTRTGTAVSLSVTLPSVDRTTIAWLRERTGQKVQLRDPYGRKERGVFFSLSVTEKGSAQLPDVSFTFESISETDEV